MIKKISLALLGAGIIAGGAYFFLLKETAVKNETNFTFTTFELNQSEIVKIEPRDLSEKIRISGTLKPVNSTIIRSKVSGTIDNVPYKVGDKVEEGDVVAIFESSDQMRAVVQSQSNVKSAEEQLRTANEALTRAKALNAKGFSTTAALDQASADLIAAQTAFDVSNIQHENAAKAAYDTILEAPHRGIISTRKAEPSETVNINTEILSIVDTEELEIAVEVPTKNIQHVSVGDKVELNTDVSNDILKGEVIRIAPSASENTRSVTVFLEVQNPDLKAWPGTFATGEIITRSEVNKIAIPSEAISEEDGKSYVMKINEDNQVVKVEINKGQSWDNNKYFVIDDGLKTGDVILARPLRGLKAGDPVKLVKV